MKKIIFILFLSFLSTTLPIHATINLYEDPPGLAIITSIGTSIVPFANILPAFVKFLIRESTHNVYSTASFSTSIEYLEFKKKCFDRRYLLVPSLFFLHFLIPTLVYKLMKQAGSSDARQTAFFILDFLETSLTVGTATYIFTRDIDLTFSFMFMIIISKISAYNLADSNIQRHWL